MPEIISIAKDTEDYYGAAGVPIGRENYSIENSGKIGGAGSTHYGAYFRFDNINIDIGSIISSAVITLTATQTRTGSFSLGITGYAVNNAIEIDSVDTYKNAILTDEVIDWNISSDWTQYLSYNSIDISDIISEIIQREGWTSGNSIGIFLDSSSEDARYRNFYDYNTIEANKVKITINYTDESSGSVNANSVILKSLGIM